MIDGIPAETMSDFAFPMASLKVSDICSCLH